MALVFPDNPQVNDITETGGKTWKYDGDRWAPIATAGYTGSLGYTGSQGESGYLGSTGYTGSAGTSGSQGSQGYFGSTGYDGSVGYTGSAGAGYNGSQGYDGSTGYTGSAGYVGSSGFTGSQGYDGSRGDKGYDGSQGPAGTFGGAAFEYVYSTDTSDSPNSGVLDFSNTALNDANTLYIPFSDVLGANSYSFLQTIDDSTSSIKGHFSLVDKANTLNYTMFAIIGAHTEHDNHFHVPISYLSGSTSFTNNSNVVITFARTGDVGDQGPAGYHGSTGYAGSLGYTGSQGEAGAQGSAGYFGSTGYLGSTGYTGSEGYLGSTGYTGSLGFTGSQGAEGYLGSTGYTGSQGLAGSQGAEGYLGSTGYTGSEGYTGSRGTEGYLGSTGYTGSEGYTGSRGTEGYLGSTGYTGSFGFTGSQGPSGSISVSGSDTQVLFNDSGSVNASAGFTFTKSTNTLNILDGGKISVGNSTVNVFITSTTVDFSNAQHLYVPSGNTTNRPTSSNGTIRYNSFTTRLEVYANNEWQEIGANQENINSGSVTSGSVTTDTATILEAFVNTLEANSITIADGFSVGNSTVNTSINAIALFSGNSSTNATFSSQRIFVGGSSANATIKLTSETYTVNISSVTVSAAGGKLTIDTIQDHGLVGVRGVPFSITGSNNIYIQNYVQGAQFSPVIEDSNTISIAVSPSVLRNTNKISDIQRISGTQKYTTVNPHGLKTGDKVTITGFPSPYQLFNATDVTITRETDNRFSFLSSNGNRSLPSGSPGYSWTTNALTAATAGNIRLTINSNNHGLLLDEYVTVAGTFSITLRTGLSIAVASSASVIRTYKIVAVTTNSFTIEIYSKAANETAISAKSGTITTASFTVNRDVAPTSVLNQGGYISFPVNQKFDANGTITLSTPQEISVSNSTHFTKITPQSLFIGKPGTTGPNILIDPQGRITQNVPGSSLETVIDGTGITMSSLSEFGDFADTNTHQFFVNSSIITLGNTESTTIISSSNVVSQEFIASSEQVRASLTTTGLSFYNYEPNTEITPTNTVYGITQAFVKGSIYATDVISSPSMFSNTLVFSDETGGIVANGSFGTNNQVLISNNGVVYWSSNLVMTDLTVSGKLYANGSSGNAGQVLTTNGSSIYWSTSSGGTGGGGSFDANVSYEWNATQTFNANVTFNSGLFGSISPRVNSNTSASTLVWTSNSFDQYQFTALAANLTIQADSGSPNNGQKIIFRIKDNGTARTLTWTTGSSKAFRSIGVTLPTSTVISKILYVGAIYNSTDDRWDVIATAQET